MIIFVIYKELVNWWEGYEELECDIEEPCLAKPRLKTLTASSS